LRRGNFTAVFGGFLPISSKEDSQDNIAEKGECTRLWCGFAGHMRGRFDLTISVASRHCFLVVRGPAGGFRNSGRRLGILKSQAWKFILGDESALSGSH
jgi:hypothetical protein